jgi:WD40 repeat protein
MVQLWDAMNQVLLWTGSCSQSVRVSYSPAANKVFGMNGYKTSRIHIWDIAARTTRTVGNADSYCFCRCNNSGTRLLTQVMAPGDRKLRVYDEYLTSVWDIENDIKLFSQSCSVKYAAYFTSDDSKLVAASMECLICVFDSESGDAILNFPAMNNDDEVLGVGSKKNICYTHYDRRLGVWDCDTGSCIFQGNTDGSIRTVCFGPNDDSIIASSANPVRGHSDELCCWNLTDGSVLFKTNCATPNVYIVLSPYTVGFVTKASSDGVIQEYDSISGALTNTVSIAVKADMRQLVASSSVGVILL